MKKSIFIITFILIALFFSFSCVFAAEGGEKVVNGLKDTAEGAVDVAEDAANGAGNAIKNGANNVRNVTQNASNGVDNAANGIGNAAENVGNDMRNAAENVQDNMENQANDSYTATRTASENAGNNTSGWMNRDLWTWIVVGIITIVIVALIWYYASRNNR